MGSSVRASGTALSGSAAQAVVAQLVQARQECAAHPADALAPTLDGQTVAPGHHLVSGSAALTTGSVLQLTGDTADVTVIRITGDLTVEAGAAVLLAQNRPGNVYWVVDGQVQLQDGAALPGVVLGGSDIGVQGRHYGSTALLTEGSITLTDLDALEGTQVFYAPNQQLGQRIGPCPATDACAINRVTNGSFEDGTGCPFLMGSFGYQSIAALVCAWYNPDTNPGWQGGSPDWFHRCATGLDVQVPVNRLNTSATPRQPRSGDAYAGVYSVLGNGREYIQQRLGAPLQAGQQYYAEFYVSLAPASRRTALGLGMAVTSTAPVVPITGSQVLSHLTPQITNGNMPLPTGVNPSWTRIGGTFTAAGGEQYITIGNFLPDAVNGTNTLPQNGPGITGVPVDGAYYFIEDVSIVPIRAESFAVTIPCSQSQAVIGQQCLNLPPGYVAQWSPTTGLGQPNATSTTAAPAVPTTYTLTVSAGGQAVQTYAWNVTPLRSASTTLGSAGAPTTLNANGGTITYSGNYRVLGELVLTNGIFELTPGTRFWMDIPLQPNGEPSRGIVVGANATLRLNNATIEAFCTDFWRGIQLDGLSPNTRLIMENNSTIADAKYGVLAEKPTTYPSYDTYYSISNSTFRNNLTHVFDESAHLSAATSSVISGSSFVSTANQMLSPYSGLHTYEALHLAPFNSTDGSVLVSQNSIDQAVYGIVSNEPDRSRVHITGNLMQNIYSIGIWLWNNHSNECNNNSIYLNPENQLTSPQIAYNSPATGIYCGSSGFGTGISNFNYVYGATPGAYPNPRPQIGTVAGQNQRVEKSYFFNLDVAMQTQSGRPTLIGNRAINCGQGVQIGPATYSTDNVTIRCNSFSRTATNSLYSCGIVIPSGSSQNAPIGSSSQPAGNLFSNIQEPLRNDGPVPVTYWRYNSSQENVSGTGTTPPLVRTNITLSPVNACRNQTYTAGVNAARGTTGGNLAFVQALMDSVLRRNARHFRLKDYQGEIVRYFADRNDLAALEPYLNRLEAANPEAHRSIGLAMLAIHRQQRNAPRAQWVRAQLLRAAAQDAEVRTQIKFSEVLVSLAERPVRPGQRLLAADSVALRQVAMSGSDVAEDAAIWLRYYYPQALPTDRPAPLRPAATATTEQLAATPSTHLDGASPNPASTELTVHYALGSEVRRAEVQVYSLLTGKRVLTQALPAQIGPGQQALNLRGLPPGQYSYRLMTDGRTGPAKHLIIAR
ncbi:hypothetical protein GCM10027048_36250 [Hymenobacter coalescens]